MFETAIAGSLPKPAWLAETNKLWPKWMAEGDSLKQAKADATLLWIKAQEDAGLDVVGDGEQAVLEIDAVQRERGLIHLLLLRRCHRSRLGWLQWPDARSSLRHLPSH